MAPKTSEGKHAIDVLLLTKDDCNFCEEAKFVLGNLAQQFAIRVSTTDLNSPEGQAIALRGGLLFAPGIVIDGRPFSYGRLSVRKLRRELERLTAEAKV